MVLLAQPPLGHGTGGLGAAQRGSPGKLGMTRGVSVAQLLPLSACRGPGAACLTRTLTRWHDGPHRCMVYLVLCGCFPLFRLKLNENLIWGNAPKADGGTFTGHFLKCSFEATRRDKSPRNQDAAPPIGCAHASRLDS
jgi:hypothetical protein